MSQTREYSELVTLVEGLCGSDDLSTSELARIKAFANRRARKAYRETDYWPAWLVSGEERQISSAGVLPTTESGLDTVDTLLRLHASAPFGSAQAGEYQTWHAYGSSFKVTGYIIQDHSTEVGAYGIFATYKKAMSITYGTGGGETSDVPEEWWEYMAQGAYADWLRSEGQTEKAVVEEAIAADLLNQQLEKVSRNAGIHYLTRHNNHHNRQIR